MFTGAVGVAIGTWKNVCATCPSVAQIRTFETAQTSKLLSHDGRLIVETSNFSYDPIGLDDMAGLPSSTRKSVTEIYWRDDTRLNVDVIVTDPPYLATPARAHFEWEPTDFEMQIYECDPVRAREPLELLPDETALPALRN